VRKSEIEAEFNWFGHLMRGDENHEPKSDEHECGRMESNWAT
jgi:hypothetical protein